jgi:Fic family protein
MRRQATGHYEETSTAGETVRAFLPAPLPPEPPVALDVPRQALNERALLACGRLDGVSSLLPDPELFLYAYVRREALLSSQRPLTSINQLKELSGLSFPTAGKAIEALVELGIAREITGGRRNRLFVYDAYLRILSEGSISPLSNLILNCSRKPIGSY